MSIGNKIYKLRTAKNLSQGNLADMLDVSRQSVSKWETDAAVPDLDKLIKLCDAFSITLDELTGRNNTETQPILTDKSGNFSAQKIIGYILFTISLLFGLFIILFGKSEEAYIILFPIAIALLVCGLLCLFAGSRAFYWCIWTAFAPLTVLTPYLVMFSTSYTFTIILFSVAITMIFVANAVFKDVIIKTDKRKRVLLILGWILPAALYALHIYFLIIDMYSPPHVAVNVGFSMLLNLICYALTAWLETYTVCYLKSIKTTRHKTEGGR